MNIPDDDQISRAWQTAKVLVACALCFAWGITAQRACEPEPSIPTVTQ